MAHQYRYEQWSSILDDMQLKFVTSQKQKREERLTVLPKSIRSNLTIYTDGSEIQDKGSQWGLLFKNKKRTVWTDKGPADGTAQHAEATALSKALQWARERKLEEINWVTDSE